MKRFKIVLLVVTSMVMFNACEKAYLRPKKVEITKDVSFATDILPILTTECATPNCHVSGGPPPDLTAAKAFDQLTGLGYVDPTDPEGSTLYLLITSTTNPMPPGGSLSPEEIGYILAWIEQGAQNN